MVWSSPKFPRIVGLLGTIRTIREKCASCSLFTALQAATDCWIVGLLFFKKRNLSLIKANDPASRNFTGGIGCAERSSPGGRAHAGRHAHARRRPPPPPWGWGGEPLHILSPRRNRAPGYRSRNLFFQPQRHNHLYPRQQMWQKGESFLNNLFLRLANQGRISMKIRSPWMGGKIGKAEM